VQLLQIPSGSYGLTLNDSQESLLFWWEAYKISSLSVNCPYLTASCDSTLLCKLALHCFPMLPEVSWEERFDTTMVPGIKDVCIIQMHALQGIDAVFATYYESIINLIRSLHGISSWLTRGFQWLHIKVCLRRRRSFTPESSRFSMNQNRKARRELRFVTRVLALA
jgi:hypothetical protein